MLSQEYINWLTWLNFSDMSVVNKMAKVRIARDLVETTDMAQITKKFQFQNVQNCSKKDQNQPKNVENKAKWTQKYPKSV